MESPSHYLMFSHVTVLCLRKFCHNYVPGPLLGTGFDQQKQVCSLFSWDLYAGGTVRYEQTCINKHKIAAVIRTTKERDRIPYSKGNLT